MAESSTIYAMAAAGRWLARRRGLVVPTAVAAMIFVILVPLPPWAMNILLVADIALAAVILLTTVHVASPLEFSVFPSVLLGATLFRLVLNVATTRLILTAGADGRSIEEAQQAAGSVIWAFSTLVTSGSLAVGVILFTIIAVIQFIVITKGATRISEVAARFVLDAMPGRQMAIDADLAAGLVSEEQARRRRAELSSQADFYGAMDGASKFVRGDAVAAVLITLVNILGGLYVGLVQYGWDLSGTADLFTRLTIGDGLVTQIPALLVSVSAALLVTRSTEKTNLGEEVVRQLTSRPVVLVFAAAFLAALSLTSLPKAPLLLIGVGLLGLAAMVKSRQQSRRPSAGEEAGAPGAATTLRKPQEHELPEALAVDPLRIELGYALVGMVEGPGGDLLGRISALRRQIAGEMGILVPPVRIRDDMRLSAHSYMIEIRNAKVGSGRLYPRQLLAVGSDATTGSLAGRQTNEPAFGTPAVWINPSQRRHAEMMNYTVVDAPSVLVTHLGEMIRQHACELLSRQQVADMLKGLQNRCGDLVREVTERFKIGQVQKVLQNLLRERVAIHDLEAVLEAMTSFSGGGDDPEHLTECVRSALARTLSQQHCGHDGKLWCICLDGELESTIDQYVQGRRHGELLLPRDLSGQITQAVTEALTGLQQQGRNPVVLCSPQIRPTLRRMIAPALPDAVVLAYSEIDSIEVQSVATVRIEP